MEWLPQAVNTLLGFLRVPVLGGHPGGRGDDSSRKSHPNTCHTCEEPGAATLVGVSSVTQFPDGVTDTVTSGGDTPGLTSTPEAPRTDRGSPWEGSRLHAGPGGLKVCTASFSISRSFFNEELFLLQQGDMVYRTVLMVKCNWATPLTSARSPPEDRPLQKVPEVMLGRGGSLGGGGGRGESPAARGAGGTGSGQSRLGRPRLLSLTSSSDTYKRDVVGDGPARQSPRWACRQACSSGPTRPCVGPVVCAGPATGTLRSHGL